MGFVMMVPTGSCETTMCAIVTLGITSGAYVAEIARSGIMSINAGQREAGRSLGLNYAQTMWYIIIPQAIKNILPALGNELIALLKETSLVSGLCNYKRFDYGWKHYSCCYIFSFFTPYCSCNNLSCYGYIFYKTCKHTRREIA